MSRYAKWSIAIGVAVVLGSLAWSTSPLGGGSEIEGFGAAGVPAGWSFSNGPEWPGATGELLHRPVGGREGGGVLVLKYDFAGGGNYVAAMVDLPGEKPVSAVRLWVNKPAGNLMIFRAIDAEGETFQKELRFDYRGWQQLEIALDGWVHRWGGDGEFQNPAGQFHILIESQGGNLAGELLIDDVEWLYETGGTPAIGGPCVATNVESHFAPADEWQTVGPPGSSYADGLWTYSFDGTADTCRLRWDKSILGRPETLRLTVVSDGSGHEVMARFGSHFQSFERILGTLDTSGSVTFEVPMGDMSTWKHFAGEDDGIVRYPLRLADLALVKRGTAAKGRVRLVRLEFVTEYDARRTIVIVPKMTADADGQLRVAARLRSLHDQDATGRLEYSLHTLDDTLESRTVELRVPAGGAIDFAHDAQFGEHRMVEARFRFDAGRLSVPTCSTTIARAPQPPEAYELDSDSKMGVGMYLYRFHGHPQRRAWMERMCRLAAAAGVKWTREEFHWSWIEPQRGEFDFTFFDELVETTTAHGISVYGLVCYWTEWTGPPLTEEFIEPYCDFLRVLVGRYKDRIKHWEIWNEPNIFFWPGPRELYAKLLRRAYETIKEVDPDAQVLGCSTAGIDITFIQGVLDADAPFDALTVHPYRGTLEARAFIRELRAAREMVGGRDVWITEIGWPSHIGGLSEREQAGHVARTYISGIASGVARTVAWYDFREDGRDPFYNEYHFGLVRNDLTPKIGYLALAAVGRLLGDAETVGELSLSDAGSASDGNLTAFMFHTSQRHVAAIWSSGRTRLAALKLSGTNLRVLNAIGDPARVTHVGEVWTLLLERDLPIYVVADGPLDIRRAQAPVVLNLDCRTVHPGQTIVWPVVSGEVEVSSVPADWVVPPRGRSDAVSMHVPECARPGTYSVILTLEISPEQMAFKLPVEVRVVPTLLRG